MIGDSQTIMTLIKGDSETTPVVRIMNEKDRPKRIYINNSKGGIYNG